jgi:hypothetical protein
MNDLFDYLNNNSGAITVVFTAVVAFSTVVYAWLTAVLVKETRKIREVQTEPLIEMVIEPLEEAINIIRLRIKNIGLGPARNISFKSIVLKGGEGAQRLLSEFTNVNFFRNGLAYLGPNQKVHSKYTQMAKNHEEKIKSIFQFDIKDESITGKPHNEIAIIDMSEMIGMCQLGTPNLYSIAKSLENTQRILEHVTSGFKKIKTDIYTHTDREKE